MEQSRRHVAGAGLMTKSDLLAQDVRPSIVGVVDLMDGQAVHAVAGRRGGYRPIEVIEGSAKRLVGHYLSLGIERIYIADLDAITQGKVQSMILQQLVSSAEGCTEILLDLGWTGVTDDRRWEFAVNVGATNTRLIFASESVADFGLLSKAIQRLAASRVLLGMDYRGGKFQSASDTTESDWIEFAKENAVGGVVALDLAAVGTENHQPTFSLCRRISKLLPGVRLISGGGVRDPVVAKDLISVGCNELLIASALLPC